jgi:general secretion pathway protein H
MGRPQRAGFTLLELIVVIFVISLLLAILFPSFYGLEGRSLKSDARRIASLLRYLNDSAISTKVTYPLKFDLKEQTLSWKGPDGEKTEKFESLYSLRLPSKGELKEGEITVFFGPLGIQESIAIYLKDDEEKGMTVALNSLSGRTKIMEDKE